MLHLICNIIKNVSSYRRQIYDKSIHTGDEPHIYDFVIVMIIKTQFTKVTPCQTYWLKLTILFTETLGCNIIANSMLKSSLFILFCNTCIKEQHLYFSWLSILDIQFRFWTSLVHVIPQIRLCYTDPGHSTKMWLL